MQIKKLFDPSKDIYRTIEKVITYQSTKTELLKREISEYIVTESMETQFEDLLSNMQYAMESGVQNEVGVWVSGFYGSGKSSFTKYLGMALDQTCIIDGVPFLKHLQDRMNKPQTQALLSTVASRFPAAVVLLDLASEMLAGATMAEVSTVLYYKVLQWAGYSRNLKVAALERRLKKDGRYAELDQIIKDSLTVSWKEVKNDPLVIDSFIPEIAHQLYPQLFKNDKSFNTEESDFIIFEIDRVKEMIEIAREHSGKEYILFIIDEVGQYISARQNLILNIDGLAKNIKDIGDGKAWIFCTAQQTLTEDDPRAALNSPELYKLSARFPIQIDLESSDIREICYRRLLAKSSDGEKTLAELFEKNGPELRYNTQLEDARYYDADFDQRTFTDLYPFLPAHFDILLHLLGALAKSTGGIGLRSAIKVIQDILVEKNPQRIPLADQPTGSLATTVTLYDALEKDINRAAPSIHKALEKAMYRFPESTIHQEVAKTVAVLQILGNIPVTEKNIASLIHPAITAVSRFDQVKAAIEDLINDTLVPFGRKDGSLCFFSEKINDIEQERAQIPLRTIESRRIQNEALREVFSPLPSTRLNGSLTVSAGLKARSTMGNVNLAGERNPVQIITILINPQEYDSARREFINESRLRSEQNNIYLLGRENDQLLTLAAEIYRSEEIIKNYRNDPDQEVRDYCNSQSDLANKRKIDLEHIYRRCLLQGSFIFRGQITAVEGLNQDLLTAAGKQLTAVAALVFDRYYEAPFRAETNLAEKFLRLAADNLRAISTSTDPLGLVEMAAGNPQVNTNHKALVSIREFIDRQGGLDGSRLNDHFTAPPFGWSADTLRYLVASLLVGGKIKLRISGREITATGQQAIDGLKSNNAFRHVGINLRDNPIPLNVLALAATRLTDLVGEDVIPLEQEISKVATQYFPQIQYSYSNLAAKLETLGLLGAETIHALNRSLAEVLETDGSDVPQRLGSPDSVLYASLNWAARVDRALKNGLEQTIAALREHWRAINDLPSLGTPGTLKNDVFTIMEPIADRLQQENFYDHTADLNTVLTDIKNRAKNTAEKMNLEQKASIQSAQNELQQLYEWTELTYEEQSNALAELENLAIAATNDLHGIKELLNQEYTIQYQLSKVKREVIELARERKKIRLEVSKESDKYSQILTFPQHIHKHSQIEKVIQQIQGLSEEIKPYKDIEITIELKD